MSNDVLQQSADQTLPANAEVIYAVEVLRDRVNVYQVQGENSFTALDFVCSSLERVNNHHVFTELWMSADPATEGHIGEDPALGSVRTIFSEHEENSDRVESQRAVLAHGPSASLSSHNVVIGM